MKTLNVFNRIALNGAGIILALIVVSTSVKSQCPTDIHPISGETGYVAWGGPYTDYGVLIPGTSCTMNITYCSRGVIGKIQRYIEEIDSVSSGCDSLTWASVILAAREYMFTSLATDPCGGGYTITVASVFTASCADMEISPYYACKFCPGAYCAKQCDVCTDILTGQKVESNCSFTQIGTADCTTAPAGWPNLSVGSTLSNINSYPSSWLNQCFLDQSTCSN